MRDKILIIPARYDIESYKDEGEIIYEDKYELVNKNIVIDIINNIKHKDPNADIYIYCGYDSKEQSYSLENDCIKNSVEIANTTGCKVCIKFDILKLCKTIYIFKSNEESFSLKYFKANHDNIVFI